MKNLLVFLILMTVSLSFSIDTKKKEIKEKIIVSKKKIETQEEKIRKEWFKLISKWEGGLGNRPKHEDAAGLTNHGITFWYWKTSAHKIVGKKPTSEALKTLTWKEAEKIGNHFWKTYKIDKIKNPALRIMVAEAYWGSGNVMGIRSFGYKSIKDLNKDKTATPLKLYNKRLYWLKNLKNWEYNKIGWSKRLKDDLKIANKF